MDYIKLAKALTGSNNVQVKRKTATATSDSVKGKVTIDVGGNKIDVPVIGTVKEGETVIYTSQDGAPIAYAAPGSGDDLQAQVDGVTPLKTLIRETEEGVEVAKVDDTGAYVGARTLQKADSYNICDKDGKILASFGEKELSLGNLSTDAVIKLLGGLAQIQALKLGASDDSALAINSTYGAQFNIENETGVARILAQSDSASGSICSIYSMLRKDEETTQTAEIEVIGGRSPLAPSMIKGTAQHISLHGTLTLNDEYLTDHITQSYASGNWYVERYASGLVKQYWYGNATYINGTAVILTQSIPVSLSKLYAAHVTPTDYRVSKVYYMPPTSTGTLTQVMIGGTATEAHTSPISITLVGKA